MKLLLLILLLVAGCVEQPSILLAERVMYVDGGYYLPASATALLAYPDQKTRVCAFFDVAVPLVGKHCILTQEQVGWMRQELAGDWPGFDRYGK